MEHDPNCRGHLPSRVLLMGLFGSPVQKTLCPTIWFLRARRAKTTFIEDLIAQAGLPSKTIAAVERAIDRIPEKRKSTTPKHHRRQGGEGED